jgi:prepilin-type N-terminal cleavage/methylation domain-containing protein
MRAGWRRQSGFTLIEVMFASMILSVFVLGIGAFWYAASQRAADLVLKQKAIFVLNAEVERLTAIYVYTAFGADLLAGAVTTTGYDGLVAIPTTRLIYPNSLSGSYASNNYLTTSAATFSTGSEFLVWVQANFLSSLNRNYVWIDKNKNIVGRLSWVMANINVASCIQALDCSCQRYDNDSLLPGHCQTLDVYLEYPYRFDAAAASVTPPAQLQTISLRTIVGRG